MDMQPKIFSAFSSLLSRVKRDSSTGNSSAEFLKLAGPIKTPKDTEEHAAVPESSQSPLCHVGSIHSSITG